MLFMSSSSVTISAPVLCLTNAGALASDRTACCRWQLGLGVCVHVLATALLSSAVICCHVRMQGVFIWRSAKTSELLKALLLRQPADTEGPPAQQHSPVSAGRRCADSVPWRSCGLRCFAAPASVCRAVEAL